MGLVRVCVIALAAVTLAVNCAAGPLPHDKPLTLLEVSDLAREVVSLRARPRSLQTVGGASLGFVGVVCFLD